MDLRTFAFLFVCSACSLIGRLDAQTPAAAALSGVVRDVAGSAIAGVEVSLIGESLVARSDSLGRFILRDIPPGGHVALFRRIGYTSVEYRWVARANSEQQVAVVLSPVTKQLDRVIVEAPGATRPRGTSSIGGTVSDSAGRPVAGADVRLLGAGLSTVADSSGRFEFRLLAAGSYIIRARRLGLAPNAYVIQIVDDDNRSVSLKLRGLSKGARDTASASGYGVSDIAFDAFDRRARVTPGVLLGPGALFQANRASLEFVLHQYRARSGESDDGDCLLIDGRRGVFQPLRTFTSLDVQLVEVFRSTAFVDDAVMSAMAGIRECQGTVNRHPPYFVLWTRALR
ncbi:MAG TPA: carboxypeptidase regulatory-like domain-containing protein [Gemmatimonadaceae bacterium]